MSESKRGRKPLPEQYKQNRLLSVMLTQQEFLQLQEMAAGLPVSALARTWIRQHLAEGVEVQTVPSEP